mmetsp:Transcript_57938/g.66130  ORF Transcript_57938/g.66130 Transcript_57938/m.66130 type:complete len:88 (+) Transcript_57938:66-329(+)
MKRVAFLSLQLLSLFGLGNRSKRGKKKIERGLQSKVTLKPMKKKKGITQHMKNKEGDGHLLVTRDELRAQLRSERINMAIFLPEVID